MGYKLNRQKWDTLVKKIGGHGSRLNQEDAFNMGCLSWLGRCCGCFIFRAPHASARLHAM